MHLVDLEREADEVEGTDDEEFAGRLQSGDHETDLDEDDVREQRVVPCHGNVDEVPEHAGHAQADEDGDGEGAADRFGPGEADELAETVADAHGSSTSGTGGRRDRPVSRTRYDRGR